MFLTDHANLTFDGLDFTIKIPGDEELTALFLQSTDLSKDAITPAVFSKMAATIAPFVETTPAGWESFPQITKNRLLFEIAKYILNESLSIPELKKK